MCKAAPCKSRWKMPKSAFTFAGKISNAQTVQEVMTLQTQFAQERMQAFVTQTQQLYSAIAEAFQKSERGTVGISMGAMPSNLIPSNLMTGFKDIQDRAVAMAKMNAEFSISLGRKDRQGTEFPGRFRTSGPLCSRADAGLRRADAGASKADRGNSPEAPTRLKQKPRPRKARLKWGSALLPKPPLDTAGILLPSPVCLSASNRKQMKNDIKFYNQPSADRADWCRLVVPGDEADPFIEHTLHTDLRFPLQGIPEGGKNAFP